MVTNVEDKALSLYRAKFPVRFVTSASLFDGHDAAINIMRRLLQAQGAEVIHLGHNRSVDQVVSAAIAEDVQGIAISSYQGGHLEYFRYLIDQLRARGRGDIKVYGGGGGVIIPSEIDELQRYGVSRIFSPADGQRLGLERMINLLIEECDIDLASEGVASLADLSGDDPKYLARLITCIEAGELSHQLREDIYQAASANPATVLGITGTGGAGKSSLIDELILRIRLDQGDALRVAVLAVDPSKRRGGGALLGDRIRMNAIDSPSIFFRSMATRDSRNEVPTFITDVIRACQAAQFDLIILETPGIGQGDGAVADVSDLSMYVMTPEFGAASQLEKIEMIDLAGAVAINKFDRRGAEDARRSVCRQWFRSHPSADQSPDAAPVFGTIASRFNDEGTTALYQYLRDQLVHHGLRVRTPLLEPVRSRYSAPTSAIIPGTRTRYLAEVCETVRGYHENTETLVAALRRDHQVGATVALLHEKGQADLPSELLALLEDVTRAVDPRSRELLDDFEQLRDDWASKKGDSDSGDSPLQRVSLSGTMVDRVTLPRWTDRAELLRWLRSEHLPGHFPFTAGVFPFKRANEDPARMFAGEGDPQRTNLRFHLLSKGQPATRLSTAFDSVTLYGRDPNLAPDIYGKVGTSGVSVATLDDMKTLYGGFNLCDPSTSVSMTINGPAPTILAMFLNTAIDQQLDAFEASHHRAPSAEEAQTIRAQVLRTVRGTVQADILKEDQGQNTCIFSTEFSLGVMADIQEYFVANEVKNFYSVSISGYHIAEAGANPITQLAFTLANGFTYVEAYLARGMAIDDFASNFSFFFSNGMDPEYTVIGRVARRIWAIAIRDKYQGNGKSQKLKYHVQTSGRSLHAQEMSFNDIRTTLQALCAMYDNANSLHTNAYDEAVTTPSTESVRRALAIQMIINQEWGLSMNENPLQGSFVVEELTDLVEAAVLAELDRISERGGVLGAMETGYQRGRIQDDSMLYEHKKHDGSLPIVGVNTFVAPSEEVALGTLELARGTEEEKQGQIRRLADFHQRHADRAPAALARLRDVVLRGDNVFAELLETVKYASLGQITETLFEVGGVYRRNM